MRTLCQVANHVLARPGVVYYTTNILVVCVTDRFQPIVEENEHIVGCRCCGRLQRVYDVRATFPRHTNVVLMRGSDENSEIQG